MSASLFFYDLETSGLPSATSRIMQFAGQRTDLDLNPIEPPINQLIRLNPDILPDPTAVLIHGISPQQTILEGLTEAEFLKLFYAEIVRPSTTFIGFNNCRFDDEFMRFLNYRNLYDPYSWSYANNCSRWDILDIVRATRALRPDGINWPVDNNGKKINKLEALTAANGLKHEAAHDALSDVQATIEVAQLIKTSQPKLYDYFFNLRLKENALKLVNTNQPFIYTSYHYPESQYHTTAVIKVADHPSKNCVMVYDLRFDPTSWLNLTVDQLVNSWQFRKDRPIDDIVLPVKTIRLNRFPAIAPIGVIGDNTIQARLEISLKTIIKHQTILNLNKTEFAKKLTQAVKILNNQQQLSQQLPSLSVDERMYDGFYSNQDRNLIIELHQNETAQKIRLISNKFKDERLIQLSSLYLARNYPDQLVIDERVSWDKYLQQRLFTGGEKSLLALYFNSIQQLATEHTDARSKILLEDLKLYGESLIPSDINE